MVVAVICGGGNGAHCMAGIAASQPGTEVRVLTMYADEAERWTNFMKTNDFIINIYVHSKVDKVLKAKPKLVTKDPAAAVPGADIIIITVPAFAHAQYLEGIKPHLKPGTVIVGMPGQPGFDFQMFSVLGDKAATCTLLNMEVLPWACRIKEFGKEADVLGLKNSMWGSVLYGNPRPSQEPDAMMQHLLGPLPKVDIKGHLVCMTLMGVNAMLHPEILWAQWSDNMTPVTESPLFYQGVDDRAAATVSAASDEVLAIAKGIKQQRPQVDITAVQHLHDWYCRCYQDDIEDKSNLKRCLQTNPGYRGLTHPVRKTDDGKLLPDFTHRYLTEDIPFGLAVLKGCAEVVGVATPIMDKVLIWCQTNMGKEYMVNGKLAGKDVGTTRAPQRFGLTTLDKMLGL